MGVAEVPDSSQEVRSILLASTFPELKKRLGNLEPLFEGLGFTLADIPGKRAWLPWDGFVTFLERAAHAVGGMGPWEDVSADMVLNSVVTRMLAAVTPDTRMIYVRILENVTRKMYRSLGARVELPDRHSVRIIHTFPRHLRVNEAWWRCTVGIFRSYPRFHDLPAARVEADWNAHEGVFDITILERRAADWSISSALHRVFSTSPNETSHDAEQIAFVMEDAPTQDIIAPVAQRVMAAETLETFCTTLVEVLRERFQIEHLSLSLASPGAPAFTWGRAGSSSMVQRALVVGNRDVGSLSVDLPVVAAGERLPAFEMLLPWIAAALDRHRNGSPRPHEDFQARIRAMETQWALTSRQRDTLELVVRGLANKEVAQALQCSVKTVEAHLTSLLRKSGMSSRSELTAAFWSHPLSKD